MLPPLLRLFFADQVGTPLPPHTAVGPDSFPLIHEEGWAREHELITELLTLRPALANFDPKSRGTESMLFGGSTQERTRAYLALLERMLAHELKIAGDDNARSFTGYDAAPQVLLGLLENGVALDHVLEPTLRWAAYHRGIYYSVELVRELVAQLPEQRSTELNHILTLLWALTLDGGASPHYEPLLEDLERVVPRTGIFRSLIPGDAWSEAAARELESDPARELWLELLAHCQAATSAKPSAKWMKQALAFVAKLGKPAVVPRLIEWFALSDKPKTHPVLDHVWESVDERQRLHDLNANALRGLVWLCPKIDDPELTRAITKLALASYRKIRGLGPRCVKLGNAAVYALGEIGSTDAVGQLAILKVRVKFGTAQKGIEQALSYTAEKVGIPRDELEEMSVPAYGLAEVGRRSESLGDYRAELEVDSDGTALTFFSPQNKALKSVPAAVQKDFAEDLKELKQAVKDIDRMLPAQITRIEAFYLEPRRWPLPIWRERYLDHPLVGVIARRLIWTFKHDGRRTSAIFRSGELTTHDGTPFRPNDLSEVELWHPLDESSDVIASWRSWLLENEVCQPFKQAHREIYLLTDAERQTSEYSNRFAAHVLKQHQFNALCGARSWSSKLRLMVDDTYAPPHRILRDFSLRAEYWVEGAGDTYGVDTAESGAFLYLTTDQVRFYRAEATISHAHAGGGGYYAEGEDTEPNQPLSLDAIPPLVFSEIMRDVDLFVGVASVGNDPNWSDGGPGRRHVEYWQSYSFGELSATAKTRRELLQILIPKLKIADRCSFLDRFLVIRGDLRTYKIHLGSGNILMEPTDQYLCIVPKQSAAPATGQSQIFLPFQGDATLSVILSKALMLAADTKIKDPSITSQIQRPN